MIILLTGEHGAGKTRGALQFAPLKKIALFHDDNKAVPNFNYGFVCDMAIEGDGKTKFEFSDFIMKKIDDIPEYIEAVIFDTWTRFGTNLTHSVVNRDKAKHVKSTELVMPHLRDVVGSQYWKAAYIEEAAVLSRLQQKFKTVIVTSHLKEMILGKSKTGKFMPDVSRTFNRVTDLKLWLRPNPEGVPYILVLKRISIDREDKNGMLEVVNMLPRKITPLPDDKTIWQAIDRYKEDPIGNRKPTPEETPSPYELSILEGFLTKEQKQVWKSNRQAEEGPFAETEQEKMAKELKGQGLSLPQIKKNLQAVFPEIDSIAKVTELLDD